MQPASFGTFQQLAPTQFCTYRKTYIGRWEKVDTAPKKSHLMMEAWDLSDREENAFG